MWFFISLLQLLAINIQTFSNWSIFTAFRPNWLSHSHWLDFRLLFLHYWVFIHCSDHYRHVSSFNYIYILFLVIRFYIFQCFVTKTLSLLPLFPEDRNFNIKFASIFVFLFFRMKFPDILVLLWGISTQNSLTST